MAKESLNETTVALVLLEKCGVFAAEVVGVLSLQSDFAFKLANVFCELLVSVFLWEDDNETHLFFWNGRRELTPCF